jgi:uncharacterized membrane protein YphA (DoxX/SURF4 family)
VLRLFSFFPSGLPGAALVLLRLCTSAAFLMAVLTAMGSSVPLFPLMIVVAMAACLCAGLWTQFLCITMLLAHWFLRAPDGSLLEVTSLVLTTLQIIALALLGPGAFSCDARRFGRRVLVLPKVRGEDEG